MEDDQFGGRTDDALFMDDFQPVEAEYVISNSGSQPPATAPTGSLLKDEVESPAVGSQPTSPIQHYTTSSPSDATSRASSAARPTIPSQHAPKNVKSSHQDGSAPTSSTERHASVTKDGPPSAAHISNTAGPNRHLSGANPRVKLTEAELTQKMEAMRILNAETARKFEEAQQDSRSHEMAYERDMEEARRREAERYRYDNEKRVKLEEERERNRARKMKALGSWDLRKKEDEEQHSENPATNFRSAHGGIRGAKRGGFPNSHGGRDPTREQGAREAGRTDARRSRGRGAYDGSRPHEKRTPTQVEDFPPLGPVSASSNSAALAAQDAGNQVPPQISSSIDDRRW